MIDLLLLIHVIGVVLIAAVGRCRRVAAEAMAVTDNRDAEIQDVFGNAWDSAERQGLTGEAFVEAVLADPSWRKCSRTRGQRDICWGRLLQC
jgi:hypothetical protein